VKKNSEEELLRKVIRAQVKTELNEIDILSSISTGLKDYVAKPVIKFTTSNLAKSIGTIASFVPGKNNISRMFFDFVKQRKAPWTERDNPEDIQKGLQEIVKWSRKNLGLGRKRKKVSFGDDEHYAKLAKEAGGEYAGSMAKQMSSISDAFTNYDPLHNIRNTLTHMYIEQLSPNEFEITDVYDFNPVVNILPKSEAGGSVTEDPSYFKSWRNFAKFLSNAASGKLMIRRYDEKKKKAAWIPVDFLSKAAIEHLSRFYQGLYDYSGYPIKMRVTLDDDPVKVATKSPAEKHRRYF